MFETASPSASVVFPGAALNGARSVAPPMRDRRLYQRRITLLVVDEHPVVQCGVCLFAQESDRFQRVSCAASGEEALAIARRERPDVALLDNRLPDLLLAEAVRRLHAVSPSTKVIVFATHLTPTLREEVAQLNVCGLLGKDASSSHLLDAITRVCAGGVLMEPAPDDGLRRAAAKLRCTPLTPREHEIIRRAARGESNAEIARAIYLAPTTVKSYLQSALGKLDARNRVEAVFKLSELGLL